MASQVQPALINLLKNAGEAGGGPAGDIELSVASTEGGGTTVTCWLPPQ